MKFFDLDMDDKYLSAIVRPYINPNEPRCKIYVKGNPKCEKVLEQGPIR